MMLLALAGSVMADPAEPMTVQVTGMRDPQMQSYRSVWAGLDAFDKYHHLAPHAGPLQFRVRARWDNPQRSIQRITLSIVGKGQTIPVVINSDGLFQIERLQSAYDDKADLVFNHKRHLFTAFAEVRTPGLASNMRRVGDLRLECQVNVAIIKSELPFYFHAMGNTMFGGSDWCSKVGVYRSIPLQDLVKATLVDGQHRSDFSLNGLRDTIKISEKDWPDEALLELEFKPPSEQ